ncbi:MAG: hypothetical protein ACXWF2_01360, partial [Usitatibacter sp.]
RRSWASPNRRRNMGGRGLHARLDGWTSQEGGGRKMNVSPIRKASAWLPIAMSLVALAFVLVHAFSAGVTREFDEGAAALGALAPVYLLGL